MTHAPLDGRGAWKRRARRLVGPTRSSAQWHLDPLAFRLSSRHKKANKQAREPRCSGRKGSGSFPRGPGVGLEGSRTSTDAASPVVSPPPSSAPTVTIPGISSSPLPASSSSSSEAFTSGCGRAPPEAAPSMLSLGRLGRDDGQPPRLLVEPIDFAAKLGWIAAQRSLRSGDGRGEEAWARSAGRAGAKGDGRRATGAQPARETPFPEGPTSLSETPPRHAGRTEGGSSEEACRLLVWLQPAPRDPPAESEAGSSERAVRRHRDGSASCRHPVSRPRQLLRLAPCPEQET